jgi:hypothetical protein
VVLLVRAKDTVVAVHDGETAPTNSHVQRR